MIYLSQYIINHKSPYSSETNVPNQWSQLSYPLTNASRRLSLQRVQATDPRYITSWYSQLTLTCCTGLFSLYCQLSKLRWLINWSNLYYKTYSALCSRFFLTLSGLFSLIVAVAQKIGLFSSSIDLSARLQISQQLILPTAVVYVASTQSIFMPKGEKVITMAYTCTTILCVIGITWFVTICKGIKKSFPVVSAIMS